MFAVVGVDAVPVVSDVTLTVAAAEVMTGGATMVGTAGATVAEGIDADVMAAAGGDVAKALNAGTVAGCGASLVGRATVAPLSAPVVMAVAMPAASDLTCADTLPIMIAVQSAAIASGDVMRRLGI